MRSTIRLRVLPFVGCLIVLAACEGTLVDPERDAGPPIDARIDGSLPPDAEADAHVPPLDAHQPPPDAPVVPVDAGCDEDRDGDFACDAADVCPDVADPDQLDTDGDGLGDACECDAVLCEGTACLTAICDRTTGGCVMAAPRADGTACDDGDACTRTDVCTTGVCVGGNPVVCEGASACREASSCVPSSGECARGAPRADGTSCSDADLCTRTDACSAGVCIGRDPVVCAPIDACHSAGTCAPASGICSTPSGPCTTDVLVRVLDARGAAIVPAPTVRAFVGTTATPFGGRVDASGAIHLLLPAGSYRFRAMRESGLPTWSGSTDHCAMPSCTSIEIRLPDTQPERAVSWDPYLMSTYGGGEIAPSDPHVERGGVYLENWAIERYGRTGAAFTLAHDHVGDLSGVAGGHGNPTSAENQHAFGETLQGIFVRLSSGGRFDLVSIDYRIRDDADPAHVSAIPGVSPTNVQMWITTSLVPAVPPAMTVFPLSSTGAAMTYWGTVFPTTFDRVTGVFITTTDNVSIDNVVVRPR